jgi:hypothetical protein
LDLFRLDRRVGLRKAVIPVSTSTNDKTDFAGLDTSNLRSGQYDPENIEHVMSVIVGFLKDPHPRPIKDAALRVLIEMDGDDNNTLDQALYFDPRPAILAWK